MPPLTLGLSLLALIAFFGGSSASTEEQPEEPPPLPAIDYVVTYYDRNGDGAVDFELHHALNAFDADWALVDTHFRGYYDLRIDYGFSVTREKVHIPIAKHVRITPGRPPFHPGE